MRRVARLRIVIVTFDPDWAAGPWIYDYFPEMRDVDDWFPPLDVLARWMGDAEVTTIPVPFDCEDLFLEAMYGRPELVLDPVVRANCSGFARLGAEDERRGVERLRGELDSGEWDRRYGELRNVPELEGGLEAAAGGAVAGALVAQAQVGDQGAVALDVGALEVAQQAAALADEHQQAATRVVVLDVRAQVLGELVDPLGHQGDLDLGGAGVVLGAAVLADELALLLAGDLIEAGRLAAALAREACRRAELAGLGDVAVHLGDQVLGGGEALLPRRRSMNATRSVCP